MPSPCKACQQFDAPSERGVFLCAECTRTLLQHLANPHLGVAAVKEGSSYADACSLCGEFRGRRIVHHPEWGRICEVDVREAAEVHRLQGNESP